MDILTATITIKLHRNEYLKIISPGYGSNGNNAWQRTLSFRRLYYKVNAWKSIRLLEILIWLNITSQKISQRPWGTFESIFSECEQFRYDLRYSFSQTGKNAWQTSRLKRPFLLGGFISKWMLKTVRRNFWQAQE